MARDIDRRLSDLERRRKGTDRLDRVATASRAEVMAKSLATESYAMRSDRQHTRYALGAMQEVDPGYTKIGLDTAERVGKQLESNLPMAVSFRVQGSVALNVHVRGVSDVDLLTLDGRFITYDPAGCRARTYTSPTPLRSLSALQELRRAAERVLVAAYPAADVDCDGGKAIALSGGSLARPVDVVPSHWNDCAAYQASLADHDRAVTILNKNVPETIDNLPFLHIKRVGDADAMALGGVRKAIRLAKNVKNDAENESSASRLPSFDIAALMWHADRDALKLGSVYELAVLAEAQRFFDWCYRNKDEAKRLRTPDGTRTILDADAKFDALTTISIELDALAAAVAREQGRATTLDEAATVLRGVYIPKV